MYGARKVSIKLNFDECIIKTRSPTFFNNINILSVVKPGPKKFQAINQFTINQIGA